MPSHYLYQCDKCDEQELRYRNVRRCRCGGNLTRVKGGGDNKPPERIYLQCYDDRDGSLLDPTRDDVTWCVDKINDNDAVYVLVPQDDEKEIAQ